MATNIDIKIPGYRIVRTLGKGGMATIYLATQMSLGRTVALKVLNDPETPQFFERFFNEGRFVSRLNHPNIITIFDIGQGDGFYYIAMEYLQDGDLKGRILEGIKPKRAINLTRTLAASLHYVHKQGLVHRDIKPSNVLFRDKSTPVLTDFGIAKIMQMDNELTLTGTVLGSPHYLSPEQAQSSGQVDGRSDLYSLGVILFEMFTGRKPFNASSFAATLMAHLQDPIPQLPDEIGCYQPIIDGLLAKNPNDRFQTGRELIEALNGIEEKKVVDSSPPITPHMEKPQPVQGQKRPLPRSLLWGMGIGIATAATLAFINKPEPLSTGTSTQQPVAEPVLMISPQQPPVIDVPTVSTPEPPSNLSTAPIPATELTSTEMADIEPLDSPAAALMSDETIDKTDPETVTVETPTAVTANQTSNEITPLTPEEQTAQLLIQAKQAIRKYHLSYPEKNNAVFYYRRVLAIDPENKAAKEGLSQVASRYARMAQRKQEQKDWTKAETLIQRGLQVRPGHRQLQRLRTRLIEAKRPKPPVRVVPVVKPRPKPQPKPIRRAPGSGFRGLTPGDGRG